MLIRHSKIPGLHVIVLAALTFVGCGTPGPTVEGTSSLEEAIASYIDGDLQQAEARLNELIEHPLSREDLETAYLYLGRIYLATGNYEKAADVLSAGRALGGDVRFDEYFDMASRHLGASPDGIVQETHITRAQLAALIDDRFGTTLRSRTMTSQAHGQSTGTGFEGHWAENDIAVVQSAGVMTALPDGRFHPEEEVTRAAFYATVSRLVDSLGASRGVVDELFPLGYRGTIGSPDGGAQGIGNEWVSGREAADVLEAVAGAAGL